VRPEEIGQHVELPGLDVIRVRNHAPRKTSLEPETDVSRCETIPPVHDSAVAMGERLLAAEVEHELLDRALVAA